MRDEEHSWPLVPELKAYDLCIQYSRSTNKARLQMESLCYHPVASLDGGSFACIIVICTVLYYYGISIMELIELKDS